MSMNPPEPLEPAERDPAALRRTALILVALMVAGGLLVLWGYGKWQRAQAGDTRPAFLYRITKERDLRMLRQDGKITNLYDLRGKVVAVNIISKDHPETGTLSREVMKRLAERYAENPDFRMITLVIEPLHVETAVATLRDISVSSAMALPQWWLATNETATLTKFIKNELRTNIFPSYDGYRWHYDTAITVIDKNGNIRRATVPQKRGGQPYIAPFDFDAAATWDARGVKTGTQETNVQQLEKLLISTIDTLLTETRKEG